MPSRWDARLLRRILSCRGVDDDVEAVGAVLTCVHDDISCAEPFGWVGSHQVGDPSALDADDAGVHGARLRLSRTGGMRILLAVLARVLIGVGGVFVVLVALMSAIRTVILPRATASVLSRIVFRSTRRVFRAVSSWRGSFEWRDAVMAMFAPVSLVVLVASWLVLLIVGFMAVFWAVEQGGWAAAFHESGSSLFTLGFAPVQGAWLQGVSFAEAALGLGMVALLITYLPAMYSAFSRRETLVALLEVRAGSPPSAVEMLERFHRIGWTERLTDMWTEWEVWFAEIEESHTTYPVLNFYRSPDPDRHWVTAAGTVLDGAALTLSTLDVPWQPQAALQIRAGYLAMRRIADFFGIEYDPDPDPQDPISIDRAEYDAVVDRLDDAGVALKADRDQAWADFCGWRVNYDTPLLSLAELTVSPYAPWTSDRSALGRHKARVRRWGRRRSAGDE